METVKTFLVSLKENWKTSAVGIITLIASILAGFGVIDVSPEEATTAVVTSVDAVIEAAIQVISVIGGIVGLGFIFGKDGDK